VRPGERKLLDTRVLAGEGKAAKTIRTYTEAVAWFAAAWLVPAGCTGWEQVSTRDVQGWMAWLLDRYSSANASNQFRGLQQFFKWLAAEDGIGDPVGGLRPPHVPEAPVPVFAAGELSRLERACAGRSFQQRRDAVTAVVPSGRSSSGSGQCSSAQFHVTLARCCTSGVRGRFAIWCPFRRLGWVGCPGWRGADWVTGATRPRRPSRGHVSRAARRG
jgi:Phage integrase, N-terminal SAM-like domain